jgi:hypothetical protein
MDADISSKGSPLLLILKTVQDNHWPDANAIDIKK